MKSLRESLFDDDLITKDVTTPAVLNILDKYIDSNKRIDKTKWSRCLNELLELIDYDSLPKIRIKKRNVNLELDPNKLYLCIDKGTLILWGREIIESGIQYITINWKPDNDGVILTTIYDSESPVYGMLVRYSEYVALVTTPSLNKAFGDLLKHKTVVI